MQEKTTYDFHTKMHVISGLRLNIAALTANLCNLDYNPRFINDSKTS